MSLSDLIRSLPNEHSTRSEPEEQVQSTREKVSFYGMRIDAKTLGYKETLTSHNHYSSIFEQDGKTYIVPKVGQHCFDKGNLRMLLWELDDEFFKDKQGWRGKYCVWYVPPIATFWMTKLADDGVGYADVPKPDKRDFWVRSEMAEIRDQLVEKYGR